MIFCFNIKIIILLNLSVTDKIILYLFDKTDRFKIKFIVRTWNKCKDIRMNYINL